MKRSLLYMMILSVLMVMSSCNKNVEPEYTPLLFKSLQASSTSFEHNSSVTLTADVEGTNITYHWSYNSSTASIEGSGNSVKFSSLQPGTEMVLCTVVDVKGEVDSKEIYLTVY